MTIHDFTEEGRARRVRDYALRTTLRLIAAGLVLFLILRVGAPFLVSLHDTPALWLGAGLILLTPLVLIQLAFGLWSDWRRLRAA
jgi:hypothetical protein